MPRLILILTFVIGNLSLPLQAELKTVAQSEAPPSLTATERPTAGARRVEEQPRPWLDPEGKRLPFKTNDEVLEFLRTAEVIESKKIGEGVTKPKRLLLEKSGLQMHAIFRDVHVYKQKINFEDGSTKMNFRDDAIFECAAFELSRLLGLHVVPPTVERKIGGVNGTLQAWIERAMMEKDRSKNGIQAPDPWRWAMQLGVMAIFDNLIYNEDRNQGNLLITEDWLVIFIDHTRAFRAHGMLLNTDGLRYCERYLFENMKALNRELLDERLGQWLTGSQIKSLLRRRDLLVRHIENLIAQHGEGEALFTFFR